MALYTGSSKNESQGAEWGNKVEFGRHWQESHFLFDPDYRVDIPIIQVVESGKHDLYAIDTHTKYVLRLF